MLLRLNNYCHMSFFHFSKMFFPSQILTLIYLSWFLCHQDFSLKFGILITVSKYHTCSCRKFNLHYNYVLKFLSLSSKQLPCNIHCLKYENN